MDLEKLREQKKKTLGPKVAFIQYITVWELYNLLKGGKIYTDPSYQRPACWDMKKKVSYIFDLNVGGIVMTFYLVDVEKSMEECKEWGENDVDYLYYKNLHEKGYKYLSLDGNNRSISVKEFFEDGVGFTDCVLKDSEGLVDDLPIYEQVMYYGQLPSRWQKKFKNKKVPVQFVEAATIDDLHYEFAKLNILSALNHPELRNAIRALVADHVRLMAQEPMMDENQNMVSGKFWDDFSEIFTSKVLARRKSDEFYQRLVLLTHHGLKNFNIGEIDLGHEALDQMFYDDLPKKQDFDVCEKLCKVDVEIAKIIKGKAGLKPKFVINFHIFQLALRNEGFFVNTADPAFEQFANELFHHETLRKQWFCVSDEDRKKRQNGEISDEDWKKILLSDCYEYAMDSANGTRGGSLHKRLEACKKSVDVLTAMPQFETLFETLPTPRKSFGLSTRERIARSQNWVCALTGRGFTLSQLQNAEVVVDHWVPLNKGGSNDLSNIRIMFAGANIQKSDDFVKEISYDKNTESEDFIEKLQEKKFADLGDGFTAVLSKIQSSFENIVNAVLVESTKTTKYMNIIHNEGVQQ